MALFFPIVLLVISLVLSAGFSIFSQNIVAIIPAVTDYQHSIIITLSTLTTLSGIWLADAIGIKMLTHAFASVLRKNPLAQKLLPIMKLALRLAIWGIGAITVVSGLGYNVTSLLAGTGFLGVGLALAGKEMLGNLIGSLSLVFGKLFSIGDTIKVKDFEGEVVEINLSRTKLINSEGMSVYIPNKFLISEAIENKSERLEKEKEEVATATPPKSSNKKSSKKS